MRVISNRGIILDTEEEVDRNNMKADSYFYLADDTSVFESLLKSKEVQEHIGTNRNYTSVFLENDQEFKQY